MSITFIIRKKKPIFSLKTATIKDIFVTKRKDRVGIDAERMTLQSTCRKWWIEPCGFLVEGDSRQWELPVQRP